MEMWVYVIAAVIIFILLKELARLPTVGNYSERYVFITGCDTGFGNLLAKRLDSLKFNVFAGCFTEIGADELRKVSSARLKTLSLDVTKCESIQKAREFVVKNLPPEKGLWAVVNNAGVSCAFAVTEMLLREDYELCNSVNLYGMIDVTRCLLPLVRKGQGRVVNMSSVAGRVATGCAPYTTSKYGVEAFSDCLRREVLKQRITVHIIEPSAFRTEILSMDNVRRKLETAYRKASPDVKAFYGNNYVEDVLGAIKSNLSMVSDKTYKVVDAYTHAITAMFPKYRYLVGRESIFFWILWNLPEWISDPLLAKIAPTPKRN